VAQLSTLGVVDTTKEEAFAVIGVIFCLGSVSIIVWHLFTAFKTGRILRFSRFHFGQSAFLDRKDDNFGFWYAVVMACFLSAALLCGAVIAFLGGFFPSTLHRL
jgi:fatty acid desaturase